MPAIHYSMTNGFRNPLKPHNLFCLLRIGTCIQFIFYSLFTFSQTTNISGVINTYHRVTETLPASAAVRVDNASGLAYGNYVLLIQMKGATISTFNNSTFGDTTSLNNAGNYEVAVICSVQGDTVYFFNQLLNSYTVADKVQLVKFGEYYSANVTDTVKPMSWDNTSGKGGVLAIRVDEDLTLNAPVFADSSGYEGGSFLLYASTCSNFFPANGFAYDGNITSANGTGAFKGEGVAVVASTQDGGRGAPANGGGGGNNHNNGGGGGANLNNGGNGGGNYTNLAGACTGDYHGLAGKALSSWAGTKIFAGGGGGAGHVNNNPSTGGGNGGGIIIVIAKNIIGNGYKISANGYAGGNSGSDGASGGGAAGTIIMNVINSYTGSLTIEAKGGNGGNSNNQNISGRCYGAGGGGSGGTIYFNSSIPAITTSVSGGAAGLDLGVTSCGPPKPAANGNNGLIVTSYAYRTSTNPSNVCPGPLPVSLVYFTASLTTDKKVNLKWNVSAPEEIKSFAIEKLTGRNSWQIIKTMDADAAQQIYEAFDNSPLPGENIYRLQLKTADDHIIYSAQRKVVFKINPDFTIFPNPAKNKIIVTGKFIPGSRIRIVDLNGKMVAEKIIDANLTSVQMELPALSTGVYLVKIGEVVQKIFLY